MTFEEILPKIKDGWTVSRPSWSEDVILLFKPEFFSSVKVPFIFIEREGKMVSVYSVSFEDLFADDFEVVEYRS